MSERKGQGEKEREKEKRGRERERERVELNKQKRFVNAKLNYDLAEFYRKSSREKN